MARYRVRPGFVLPHAGEVLPAGAELDLPRHVAEDTEIRYRLEEIEASADFRTGGAGAGANATAAPLANIPDLSAPATAPEE